MALEIHLGQPNEKQKQFFLAHQRFIAYGGARGGGKSWAVRKKALLLAVQYPGIRILLLRRTFPELRENHIRPLLSEWKGLASYRETDKSFSFVNGSRLKFGYCDSESDVLQYQGQEYDVIFMDEATQFTEYQYHTLTACLRGANDFPKRMYLTCNPGGVGHAWVKRLFIDRAYQGSEKPEEYCFIPARVYDNLALLEQDTGYVAMLENLPDALRRAWLDGDWDVFQGQFFTEFQRDIHVCEPFAIPEHWRRYLTLDYGLDMLAAYWIAVDEAGRAFVYRELYEGKDLGDGHEGLIISEAAKAIREATGEEELYLLLAPPDLWNRRQETGKSAADLFAEAGVYLTKTGNNRIDGWLAVKEWLHVRRDEAGGVSPRLRIFANCSHLIRTLPLLQYDLQKPNDVAREPHELTHAPDALRGFCIYWSMAAEEPRPQRDDDDALDYDEQVDRFLQGGWNR